MVVKKIGEKVFVGKNVIHAAVFHKNDERMTFNMIYLDGETGKSYAKRFQVGGVTRDKDYDLTKGSKNSKVHYFSANPNGEAELITVYLTASSTARKKVFDYDFSELDIKGRGAGGNIVTKYPVRKVQFKKEGKSTLGGLDIWYDETVGRLNTEERGIFLGNFQSDDVIVVFYKSGEYEMTGFDLTNRYDANQIVYIEKWQSDQVCSAVHYDGDSKNHYLKRFQIETNTLNKRFHCISDAQGSRLEAVTQDAGQQLVITFTRKGNKREETALDVDDFIDVKGWKALGNRIPIEKIKKVMFLSPENRNKDKTKDKTDNQGVEDENGSFNVGQTIELDVNNDDEKDQLGLFSSE
jgi:topoisomerase-4 subunit A